MSARASYARCSPSRAASLRRWRSGRRRIRAGGNLRPPLPEIRSWMAVPLVVKERVIGCIALSHDEPGFYTHQHAGFASAIANHAAVAIENARLYAQAQEAVRKATVLAQIASN